MFVACKHFHLILILITCNDFGTTAEVTVSAQFRVWGTQATLFELLVSSVGWLALFPLLREVNWCLTSLN